MGFFGDLIGGIIGGIGGGIGTGMAIDALTDQAKQLERGAAFRVRAVELQSASREKEQRIQQLELARARRSVAREARLARGEATQAGANAGALQSSAVQGGRGGAESVATANQAFFNQTSSAAQKASDFLNEAAEAQGSAILADAKAAAAGTRAQVYGQLASLAKQGGSILGDLLPF